MEIWRDVGKFGGVIKLGEGWRRGWILMIIIGLIIGLLEDGGRIWSLEDKRLIILRMEDEG